MNEETLPGGEVIDFMRGQLAEKLLQKSGLDTEILLLQESLNYIYANSREYEQRYFRHRNACRECRHATTHKGLCNIGRPLFDGCSY